MSLFSEKRKILITCPPRVVPYLKQEVSDLNYDILSETETTLNIEGTLIDTMKLNLYLRTAHRVLFFYHEFDAENLEELYHQFYNIEWEEIIAKDGYISISSYVESKDVNHSKFPNLKAKDAIVDRFRDKFDQRPNSGAERKGVVIYFYWVKNKCSVFIDTSGDPLSKRNYRKIPYKAPMQESLAAAVLIASGWNGKGNFINPMCGSGTLAIEAALIALNKASALHRTNFSFMNLIGYDENIWKQLRSEAKLKSLKKMEGKIIATDHDENAVSASVQNAKTAGVDHLIEFNVCDFTETNIPEGEGIIMFNPEYGERLGEERELEYIYKGIGDFLKQKGQGYTGYIFTGNLNLAKKIGLKSKSRTPFYNGNIDCRLIQFELYSGSHKFKG